LTLTKVSKTATELGLECEVITDVGMNHFELIVTEGKKAAQKRLAKYIKQRKPAGTTFQVVDETPEQRFWDKVDGLSDSGNKNEIKVENNPSGTKTVESVKQKYVEGEIGILELEDKLEDVIELDYDPVTYPS
jgi:hypothetical protein